MMKIVIDYVAIGQRIKTIRKRKGYIQENLAEIIDIFIVYISQIENRKTKLSLEMLMNISYLLENESGLFIAGTAINANESIPHDISVALQNNPTKKLKLIIDILKMIDKY